MGVLEERVVGVRVSWKGEWSVYGCPGRESGRYMGVLEERVVGIWVSWK